MPIYFLLSIRGAPFRRCEPTLLKPTLKGAPSYNAFYLPLLRRDFLTMTGVSSLSRTWAAPPGIGMPRWRGFNLQEKFTDSPEEWAAVDPEWGRRNEPFVETDFEWMARWGFNFVRLPMS